MSKTPAGKARVDRAEERITKALVELSGDVDRVAPAVPGADSGVPFSIPGREPAERAPTPMEERDGARCSRKSQGPSGPIGMDRDTAAATRQGARTADELEDNGWNSAAGRERTRIQQQGTMDDAMHQRDLRTTGTPVPGVRGGMGVRADVNSRMTRTIRNQLTSRKTRMAHPALNHSKS